MKRLIAVLATVGAAGLGLIAPAAAAAATPPDYYVSTTGSDTTGTGTISNPWATIGYASTQVSAGATVHVAAGVYNGSINTYAAGTATAYITYVADTADFSAPVDCAQVAATKGDISSCVQLVGGTDSTWSNWADYVAIEGFGVTGPGINGIYSDGNATKFLNNDVHDVAGSLCNDTGGAGINPDGTNAEVVGNYVYNVGPKTGCGYSDGVCSSGPSNYCGYYHGIYFHASGGYAWNNLSFGNSGFGIQLWGDTTTTPYDLAIDDNTVFGNGAGGIVLGTDNVGSTADYITIDNDLIYDNSGWGVSEQGYGSGSTGVHNVYEDNLVYGNLSGGFSLQNGLTATGTVSADPKFVNYTGNDGGDYMLRATSPAIGTGYGGTGVPSYDFDNVSRPSGHVDIGAYQYVATPTADLSPTSLSFPSTTVGHTSAVKYSTLTNAGTATLTFAGNFTISGPFAYGDLGTCSGTLTAGNSCTISVVFNPTATGPATGAATIQDNAGIQTLALSGTGV